MKFERIEVTPEIAREFLKGNTDNRAIRKTRVEMYSREMAKGMWRETGEMILVTGDGRILSGQHRLHAVVKSGATVAMWFSLEEPEETYLVCDGGISRTHGDHLGLPSQQIDIPNFWLQLRASATEEKRTHARIFGSEEILRFIQLHQEALDWVNARRLRNKGICRAPIWVAMAQYYERNPEKAEEFLSGFRLDNMAIGQAIKLRDYVLLQVQTRQRTIDGGDVQRLIYRVSCVAMEKHEAGIEIKILRDKKPS